MSVIPHFNADYFHRLRREMDDLLSPAVHMMERITHPRTLHPDDPNRFEVRVDVHQFAPEELSVKMVDNFVVVKAKHEEREDEHGFVARDFLRRYSIPPDVKPEQLNVDLSSDGILTVTAPRHIANMSGEYPLPIHYTGQPSLTHKPEEAGKKHLVDEVNQPKGA